MGSRHGYLCACRLRGWRVKEEGKHVNDTKIQSLKRTHHNPHDP